MRLDEGTVVGGPAQRPVEGGQGRIVSPGKVLERAQAPELEAPPLGLGRTGGGPLLANRPFPVAEGGKHPSGVVVSDVPKGVKLGHPLGGHEGRAEVVQLELRPVQLAKQEELVSSDSGSSSRPKRA